MLLKGESKIKPGVYWVASDKKGNGHKNRPFKTYPELISDKAIRIGSAIKGTKSGDNVTVQIDGAFGGGQASLKYLDAIAGTMYTGSVSDKAAGSTFSSLYPEVLSGKWDVNFAKGQLNAYFNYARAGGDFQLGETPWDGFSRGLESK